MLVGPALVDPVLVDPVLVGPVLVDPVLKTEIVEISGRHPNFVKNVSERAMGVPRAPSSEPAAPH